MTEAGIFQLLDLALTALIQIPDAMQQALDVRDRVELMKAEDRDPTPAELSAIADLLDVHEASIADVAARARENLKR